VESNHFVLIENVAANYPILNQERKNPNYFFLNSTHSGKISQASCAISIEVAEIIKVKFSSIVTTKKLVVKFKLGNSIRQAKKILWAKLSPVYTGDFCGDLSSDLAAIPSRPCKLAAISWQLVATK